MIAFHIVLRNNAVVLDSGFIQEVCGVGLLKKSITDVFFISKNLVDGAGPPFCFASAGEDAVCFQTFCNPVHRVALQVFTVDALYHLRLLWIDDEVTICILGVAEEVIVIYLYLAILGFLYKFCVMLNLSIVACSLLIAVSTDSAIRRDSKLWLCILLSGSVSDLPFCRDDHNISHYLTSLSIRLYRYSACLTGFS